MKETPKMPIWLLIIICILSAVIVLAVLLQLLLQLPLPGLVPFTTAGLILAMLFSYIRSPKKDGFLLVGFFVALVLNVLGGILQIITNS